MTNSIPLIAWLVAGVCFILSLSGLSRHETSQRGNNLGIIGITIAILATLFSGLIGHVPGVADGAGVGVGGYILLVLALGCGAAIGIYLANQVEMTGMPQLVAILHSFVGLAAVLVALSNHFIHWEPVHLQETVVESTMDGHTATAVQLSNEAVDRAVPFGTRTVSTVNLKLERGVDPIHKIEVFLGLLIGGYTFAGSVIAFGKLDGRIDSTPLLIPHRHLVNIGMVVLCVLLLFWYVMVSAPWGTIPLLLVTILSCVLGWHMVMAIGGADMPVVVSMLNSYSGWAAAAIGFLIPNDLLIVTGALVGSSGAILSYIMCAAMNRSFVSVILGGFGTGTGGTKSDIDDGIERTYHTTSADEVSTWLLDSDEVIVIPGYGMAVAQAQHSVREICSALKEKGIRTRFAIHPVAGRLPGHMNVLLAEAKVPYDIVLEMDEINEEFEKTGTVLVIGANDIVNPGALDDESSPIYGMPVLECWNAQHTVVLKRSMGTGYSGVDNPLFYLDNSAMLFGDAKTSVDAILQGIRDA